MASSDAGGADGRYVVLTGDDEPAPGCAGKCRKAWRAANPNVRLILVIVAFAGLSESLAFGSALASYLYIATGKSNLVVRVSEWQKQTTRLSTLRAQRMRGGAALTVLSTCSRSLTRLHYGQTHTHTHTHVLRRWVTSSLRLAS